MTDKTNDAAADQPVTEVATVVGDGLGGVGAVSDVQVQGDKAVVVAQFADMDSARVAYEMLLDAESEGSLDIDGVLVVNADLDGQIHVQKMTDHKTRNGFLWGAVGGAVLGLLFPPTILASAVAWGVVGAAVGKAGNLLAKGEVADELAGVILPGTSGIVALVAATSVDAVEQKIPEAKAVKSAPVSADTADAVKQAAQAAGDPAAK